MDESLPHAIPATGGGPPPRSGDDTTGGTASDALLIIRDLDDLKSFADSPFAQPRRPLSLRLPRLSAAEAEAVGTRLQQARTDCGCALGAKCMAAGAVAAAAWLAARYGLSSVAFVCRLPLALLAALVFAGAGKTAGILAARRRLRRDLGSLFTNLHHLS